MLILMYIRRWRISTKLTLVRSENHRWRRWRRLKFNISACVVALCENGIIGYALRTQTGMYKQRRKKQLLLYRGRKTPIRESAKLYIFHTYRQAYS